MRKYPDRCILSPMNEPKAYRQPSQQRRGLRIPLIILGVLILLGTAWAIQRAVRGTGGAAEDPPPRIVVGPGEDGPDWTYQELRDCLRERRLTVQMADFGSEQLYLLGTDNADAAKWAATTARNFRLEPDAVTCRKYPSGREAKEEADRRGAGAFAWGRFCF